MSNQTTTDMLNAADISLISLTIVAASFHIIGIIVLTCLKSKINQTSILLSLAFSEMIYCFNLLVRPVNVLKIPRLMSNFICISSNKLIMLTLLGDRFLEIFLNIKYPILISRERVFKVLSTIWLISGLYGLISGALVVTNKLQYCHAYHIHNYIIFVFII